MAILFCDSMNSYGSTSDMSKMWGSNADNTKYVLDLTGGPSSDPCIKTAGTGGTLATTLYATPSGTVLGGRFKFKQASIGSAVQVFRMACQNSSLTAQTWEMNLNATTGVVTVSLAGSSAVSQSGSTNVCDNAWHLIEWQIDAKDAAGVLKVWVDGVLEINFSGDTYSGTAHAAPWLTAFTLFSTSVVRYYKDFIIFDSSGGTGAMKTTSQPFGNLTIETIRPNGAGTTTGFTPSAGSNYQCVDETSQNGATDYVESAVSTTRDTYAMGNLAGVPTTVYGAVAKVFAENPGSGTISMKQTLKSGGTTDVGASSAANIAGNYKSKVYDNDPNTSTAWTLTTINALEQGFEVA